MNECSCKCGANSYEDHLARVANGYAGHTFNGFIWDPQGNSEG